VLNRVFEQAGVVDPEPVKARIADGLITDVEVRDLTPNHQTPAATAGQPSARNAWGLATVAGLTALVLVGGHLLIRQQQALQQERNLLLLGQLRQAQNPLTTAASLPQNGVQAGDSLPPAPPSEPWMEELAKLPQTENSTPNLLKVPLHGPLAPPNLPIPGGGSNPDSQSTAIPQLVGIIQGAGKSGSAIFQTGASSTSVAAGEAIGSSGWRLQTTNGDSAIIVRGGQQRRLSISNH
jgi:hypothetical protein